MERYASLSEWFDFGEDPLGLYPFKARVVAARFGPEVLPQLLELGRATLDTLFRGAKESRQLRAGRVVLWMPERWLAVEEKRALMAKLLDYHEQVHPLIEVSIVTCEPLIITDFTSDMVRVLDIKVAKDDNDQSEASVHESPVATEGS